MLTTYRALLTRPGALALLLVCATSWLSYSGYGLALILAVHAATRSFTTAGVATAVQATPDGQPLPDQTWRPLRTR